MIEILTTVLVGSVIAALFVAVIISEVKKKKSGKSSCSCGGNCGACDLCKK